ncbi:FAD-binding domain-containing protein [Tabrizicola sp.]|uniref:FAD-binding domain-containing protein n=1 Tax=Tabrizicola sp. TaxID=2005166 RepID=UPI00261409FD|nr:FAD-binding domain-containing protein [Tabrizicola sp.]MDM7930901.1 FAD-binding domain-containing protein [Tabrizicola sp.]
MTDIVPTKAAGRDRLAAFLPKAGRDYAAKRNLDLPGNPHVSGLSPWLRHRLLTEAEVIRATLEAHPHGAEKFLAEVWWRTYWKGWLELRPGIWDDYRQGLTAAGNRLAVEPGLAARAEAAMLGDTGIDGFDDWARELVATGYMHNHARMWFASIWIFTLRLPWELGADFFLRHLIDGDPASNTLGWRWVGGLHTPGKTYLATADNIARNTEGRFRPEGLAADAPVLPMRPHPAPRAAPVGDRLNLTAPSLLLVTEEDLSSEFLLDQGLRPSSVAVLSHVMGRSALPVAGRVHDFTSGAIADALSRLNAASAPVYRPEATRAILDQAETDGLTRIVTPYAPTGPISDVLADLEAMAALRGIAVDRILRPHDRDAWPHATHGFFRFREAVMP